VPFVVSTLIKSPSLIKRGTITVAPVSTTAGLVAFVAVFPFMPGSVDVTVSVTLEGKSTERGELS